ncbi:MAG TPA: 1-acyl-sn-glycerol-3-phosphate acyltransferase [Vicinamibacteria bacterium]
MRRLLRAALDAATALLARAVARLFFREVDVLDADRVPHGCPLVIVANHENNLMDPILLAGFLGLRPRFLAKSTLWRHPAVAPLLLLAGALPVFRRQDEGVDPARNVDTFARCHQELARGGVIALFPEGTSHSEPHRLPLKTGAARIALEAEERHGPLGLRVLPVGLVYEEKGRFRSRVIVQVGPPIDPAPEVGRPASAPREAVQRLTDRIAEALSDVTLDHASWEEARLVGRACALLADPRPSGPPAFPELWALRQRLWDAYRELRQRDPDHARALAQEVRAYERELSARGLTPDDMLAAPGPPPGARRRLGFALAAPLAAAGMLLNVVPYRAVDALARHLTYSPDQPATYKVVGALVLFPLAWIVQAAVAATLAGAATGAAVFAAAPIAGYVALRWREGWNAGRVRARRRWLSSAGPRLAALTARRDALRAAMQAVLA